MMARTVTVLCSFWILQIIGMEVGINESKGCIEIEPTKILTKGLTNYIPNWPKLSLDQRLSLLIGKSFYTYLRDTEQLPCDEMFQLADEEQFQLDEMSIIYHAQEAFRRFESAKQDYDLDQKTKTRKTSSNNRKQKRNAHKKRRGGLKKPSECTLADFVKKK